MERFITDEKTGIEYELIGDYYYPCFKAPESPVIGKYGRMRLRYLKEHHRIQYGSMLTSGKLKEHLEKIDKTANEMLERLMKQMAFLQGVTEKLVSRGSDALGWFNEQQPQGIPLLSRCQCCCQRDEYGKNTLSMYFPRAVSLCRDFLYFLFYHTACSL